MPRISEFYGITVSMYPNKRNGIPYAHFYASYKKVKAIYDFQGILLEGEHPLHVQLLLEEWCSQHFADLMDMWCGIGIAETTKWVEPLDATAGLEN